MISRFPGPWRIVELTNGFAAYDATGRQLGFFYGRTDPNVAGDADFLMIDEARQIALDFARLPELLDQTSGRSEVVTSMEDDKLAKFETNRSPRGAPETSGLLRVLVITVAGLPLGPTTIRRSISFGPQGRRSPQLLHRPSNPRSIWTKFLIPIAVAALPAGYLFFGDADPPVNVAVVQKATMNRLSAEFPPPPEAEAPLPKGADITVESRIEAEAAESTIEIPGERQAQTTPLQLTRRLDTKGTESGSEARPPQTLRQKEGRSFTPSQDAPTCFPSASAVRQNYPEGWPSWTMKAPGHEGTRCWYPTKRTTANDYRSEMRRNDVGSLPIGAAGDTKKHSPFLDRE